MNGQAYTPEGRCEKCGCRKTKVFYEKENQCRLKVPNHEHLRRQCTCCGFEWWEKCIDEEALKALDAKRGYIPSALNLHYNPKVCGYKYGWFRRCMLRIWHFFTGHPPAMVYWDDDKAFCECGSHWSSYSCY